MPAQSLELRRAVARAGGAVKHGNPVTIKTAKRDLAAERIATYIERVVSAAPPLTPVQVSRLSTLLQGGGSSD